VDAPQNENDYYGLHYSDFVVPLAKAVQEQQLMIMELRQKLVKMDILQKKLEALEARIKLLTTSDSK